MPGRELEPLLSVRRAIHRVPGLLQPLKQEFPEYRIVLDHQNPHTPILDSETNW